MKAGRELDALRVRVAVEVFGWKETDKRLSDHDPNWLAYEAPWYEIPDGSIFHYTHIPDYPRNIADAWLVVEKTGLSVIKSKSGWLVGRYDLKTEYLDEEMGVIDGHLSRGYTQAATASLAICLAALKAMENK